MLTRSVMLATALTIGLVVVVGSSAFAVAFVPGNEAGSAQKVEAIAAPTQDAADGSSASFIQGGAVTVVAPEAIVIDGIRDETPAKSGPEATTPTSEPASTEPVQTGSSDSGSSDSGSSNSGQSAADKAAEKQAKKDQKAAEEQAKKDQKAAEEQAKKDKKAAEEQAKKDKKEKKDKDTTVVDTAE